MCLKQGLIVAATVADISNRIGTRLNCFGMEHYKVYARDITTAPSNDMKRQDDAATHAISMGNRWI